MGKPAEILSSLQGVKPKEKAQPSLTKEIFDSELAKLQTGRLYDISREIITNTVCIPPPGLAWERVGIFFYNQDTSGALCNVSIDFSSYPDHEIHKEPEVSINISNGCMIAAAKIKRKESGECKLEQVVLKDSELDSEAGLEQIIDLLNALKEVKPDPKYPKGADSWEHARAICSLY